MKIKLYQYNGVEYGFNRKTRKWHFKSGEYTLIQSCPGGMETATDIAKQMSGAIKRSKKNSLDNLARKKISSIVSPVQMEEA